MTTNNPTPQRITLTEGQQLTLRGEHDRPAEIVALRVTTCGKVSQVCIRRANPNAKTRVTTWMTAATFRKKLGVPPSTIFLVDSEIPF